MAELRKRPEVATLIDDTLAPLFVDFEAGMDKFFLERNLQVPALLREMAAYFAQFEPMPGNYYYRLLSILGGTRRKAIFATLNYDLLLEIAASNMRLKISYGGFPIPAGNIPLLKLHGSCSFLPDYPDRFHGVKVETRHGMSFMEGDVRIARSINEVLEFCRREDSIAPVLAMYAKGKRVLFCGNFVTGMQNLWADAARDASKVFIIGVRVHPEDIHVWEPLAKTVAPVYYVGGEDDDFWRWAAAERPSHRKSFVLGATFEEGLYRIEMLVR